MTQATSLTQKAKSSVDGDAKRRDQILVSPSILAVQPGFNVRGGGTLTEEEYWAQEHVQAHVEGIKNAYIAGDYVPPIVVKFDPEKQVAYIRDGHHRFYALNQALSEGHEIPYVAIAECRGDEVTQQLLMLNSSNALTLTAVERAEIYNRLYVHGFDYNEIAVKVGKSLPHVMQMLKVYELPVEVKRQIQQGKLSVNSALTPAEDKERLKKRKQNKKATNSLMDALLAVDPTNVTIENGQANIQISADVWLEFMRLQEEAKAEAEKVEAEAEFKKNQVALPLDEAVAE